MVLGAERMTLAAKPSLSFAFDELDYDGEMGTATLGDETRLLNACELEELATIFAPLHTANHSSVVHGVDAHGNYLGLVPPSQAVQAAAGAPPFALDECRYDLQEKRWVRRMTDKRLARAVVVQRNALLSASDRTQLTDMPLSNTQKQAWRTYRQALRDLPTHPNFPHLQPTDWPVQPT